MRAKLGTPLGTVSWPWTRELTLQGEGHLCLDNASPREGHTGGHTMGEWSLVSSSPVSGPLWTLLVVGAAGGALLVLGLCWSFSHTQVKCLPLCLPLFLRSCNWAKTSQPLGNYISASEAKQMATPARSPSAAPPHDEGRLQVLGAHQGVSQGGTQPHHPPRCKQTAASLSLGFSSVKWAGCKGQLTLLPWRPRSILDLKAIDLSRGLLRILWESGRPLGRLLGE